MAALTFIVALEPFELEHAVSVGHRRHIANVAKQDAYHYDKARMQDNVTANVAASACEMAVAKALNKYWSGSVWDSSQHDRYRREPDIPPDLEVRRVREPGNPLAVRRRDVEAGRVMVSAYADEETNFAIVTINGWLDAETAWEVGRPSSYDKENTRLVDQKLLYPIEGLIE